MTAIQLISTTILILFLGAFAQDDPKMCKKMRMPAFSRILTITYDGPEPPPATKENIERVIGECRNVDEFMKDMLEFFSSFGFNTSNLNLLQNPSYTGRVFNLTLSVDEHPSYRVILSSFYEFGEYKDAQIVSTFGNLVTNMEFRRRESRQVFAAGNTFSYGILRVKMPHQDMCIVTHTPNPLVGSFNGKDYYLSLDYALYNKIWGNGLALGTVKVHGSSNFTRAAGSLLAFFPPEDRNRRMRGSDGRIRS